jgi:hypothetical protein
MNKTYIKIIYIFIGFFIRLLLPCTYRDPEYIDSIPPPDNESWDAYVERTRYTHGYDNDFNDFLNPKISNNFLELMQWTRKTSPNHYCISNGPDSTCYIKNSCLHANELHYYCIEDCDLPRVNSFVYGSSKSFKKEYGAENELKLIPSKSIHFVNDSNIYIVMTEFQYWAFGHVISDHIFPIYLILSSFGLENKNIIIIMKTLEKNKPFAPLKYVFDIFNISIIKQEVRCMENVIVGVSGFNVANTIAHGMGSILDRFQEWAIKRSNVKLLQNKQITIIQKSMQKAQTKHGMINGYDVGEWIKEKYPEYIVNTVTLSDYDNYTRVIELMANTNVLISSPGSDIAQSILYLQKGAKIIIIPYCYKIKDRKCVTTATMEIYGWVRKRASIFVYIYDDITKDEIVEHTNLPKIKPWDQPGAYKLHPVTITVKKEKILKILKKIL